MTDVQRLLTVRVVHRVSYVVMAASTLAVLVAGITGIRGTCLWVALALVFFCASALLCYWLFLLAMTVLVVLVGGRLVYPVFGISLSNDAIAQALLPARRR